MRYKWEGCIFKQLKDSKKNFKSAYENFVEFT